MLYYLWRLLGKCFWIKLNSHYLRKYPGQKKTLIKHYYSEWRQRKDTILNHKLYELIGESSEGVN